MKKIYVFAVVIFLALTTGCTKLDLDNPGSVGIDAGLGLPVCTFHASVFDVLMSVDSTGSMIAVNPDQTVMVYWSDEERQMEFDFVDFEIADTVQVSFELNKVSSLQPILEHLPEEMSVPLPEGEYLMRDTLTFAFDYGSFIEGERECSVDSILINNATFDFDFQTAGISLDANNYVEATFTFPNITSGPNSISVSLTDNTMKIQRTLTQFLVDFHEQMEGQTDIEMYFDCKFVSDGTTPVTKDASLNFDITFGVQDYNTGYGHFWQKDPMYTEVIGIKMPDILKTMATDENCKLYFHNPELTMYIQHNVGADLDYTVDYVCTLDENGNVLKYANFNGSRSFSDRMNRPTTPHQWADDTLRFDRENGGTNLLLTALPDSMVMACHVNVGKQGGEHHDFLVNPMQMKVNVEARMMMDFDPGFSYGLKDTMPADLTGLDASFTDYVNIKEFNILLLVKNSIPVSVNTTVVFMDENYNEIYRKPVTIEGPQVDERGVSQGTTAQDITLTFTGDDIKTILGTKFIYFDLGLAGSDAQSMSSIRATDAVDIDIRAYATFRANVDKFLK